MSFDDAYDALTDHDDDTRWAYGTGFTDPLAGVPTEPPAGVDVADLAAYCLMLGDDALILSHRLQQWVTRAPELEDELAIANIALDLLGQARLLLTRAGEVEGAGRDEDALAMDTLGLHVFDLPDVQCHFRDREPGEIAELRYGVDVNTLERHPATQHLGRNHLHTASPPNEPSGSYDVNK